MSEIRLNYEEADQAVQKFKAGQLEIEGAMDRLRSQLDGLRASWTGTASNDFEVLFGNYNDGARNMNQNLLDLSTALDSWATNVQEFEATAFK